MEASEVRGAVPEANEVHVAGRHARQNGSIERSWGVKVVSRGRAGGKLELRCLEPDYVERDGRTLRANSLAVGRVVGSSLRGRVEGDLDHRPQVDSVVLPKRERREYLIGLGGIRLVTRDELER